MHGPISPSFLFRSLPPHPIKRPQTEILPLRFFGGRDSALVGRFSFKSAIFPFSPALALNCSASPLVALTPAFIVACSRLIDFFPSPTLKGRVVFAFYWDSPPFNGLLRLLIKPAARFIHHLGIFFPFFQRGYYFSGLGFFCFCFFPWCRALRISFRTFTFPFFPQGGRIRHCVFLGVV